jgi:hypothetical protein
MGVECVLVLFSVMVGDGAAERNCPPARLPLAYLGTNAAAKISFANFLFDF